MEVLPETAACWVAVSPDGTYAYFLSDAWPWVPTYLRGTPDASFGPGGNGGPQGQGAP